MSDVGVVAIGRNEGERLRRCLASVIGRGMPVVYVDSASTDGSAGVAAAMGSVVVELDMTRPFSAARARNEGFERLKQVAPGSRFVQFVDGDCEVVEGWIDRARGELEARPEAAVVCGRRRERFPGRSVYNRLADLEWDTPVGEARSCGGDAMMRVDAFVAAGGFDASVAAGEEPELCQRLRSAGWKIFRVDAEMTVHDSAMLRYGQWWKRAVRSGYGAMDVAARFGKQGLFVRQVKSARLWALGWPAWVIGCASLAFVVLRAQDVGVGKTAVWTLAAAAVAAAVLPLQVIRLAAKVRRRVGDWRTALGYGALMMIGKWANFAGQCRYRRDRAAGRNTRLIEYKASCATPITKPT